MGRTITMHHDGHGLNEKITLNSDAPGPGGAPHSYEAWVVSERIRDDGSSKEISSRCLNLQFQEGPRNVEGSIPGITEAILYSIIIDRLEGFQAGPYSHPENDNQLKHLYACLASTKARADERAQRGVLGTYKK